MRQDKSFTPSSLMLTLFVGALGSCMQPIDTTASKSYAEAIKNQRPADFVPTTTIAPSDLPILLVPGGDDMDPTQVTTDPCVKTKKDKDSVLSFYCAKCHNAPNNQGLPPWNFVLDDAKIVAATFTREGDPTLHYYVKPGSLALSAIYTQMVSKAMPPGGSDLANQTQQVPVVSLSDIAIVGEWILHCAPGAPAAGSGGTGGGASGSGGALGSGGSPGSADAGAGGRSATEGGADAGAGGAGGGLQSDAGASPGTGGTSSGTGGGTAAGTGGAAGVAACATTVSNGGGCMGQPQCRQGSLTCTCTNRRWACR